MNSGRISRDPPKPHICELAPEHARALSELRIRAMKDCPEALGTAPQVEAARGARYYRRKLQNLRRNPTEAILGAFAEDALVGMAGFGRRERRDGIGTLVYSFYVDLEHRQQGIARALMNEAMLRAERTWTSQWIRLNVEINNRTAVDWYKALGFEVEKTENRAFRIEEEWYAVYHMVKFL